MMPQDLDFMQVGKQNWFNKLMFSHSFIHGRSSRNRRCNGKHDLIITPFSVWKISSKIAIADDVSFPPPPLKINVPNSFVTVVSWFHCRLWDRSLITIVFYTFGWFCFSTSISKDVFYAWGFWLFSFNGNLALVSEF